jgi:hypothetical protein
MLFSGMRRALPSPTCYTFTSISGFKGESKVNGILLARVLREGHFVAVDGSDGAIAPDELKR